MLTSLITAALTLADPAALPVEPFPPESVCALHYRRCNAHCCQLQRQLDAFGGWQLAEQLRIAKRWRDLWYAAWWITWRNVDLDALNTWRRRHAELLKSYLDWD